jgi:tyrosyl-tRNA synthetase
MSTPSARGVEEQLALLKRGTAEILSEEELAARLERAHRTGHPMRVKLGIDPTAPDIHLRSEPEVGDRIWIARLLTLTGMAPSTREARRLVEQGGVALAGEKITDANAHVSLGSGDVLQVGRRKFGRLVVV